MIDTLLIVLVALLSNLNKDTFYSVQVTAIKLEQRHKADSWLLSLLLTTTYSVIFNMSSLCFGLMQN